MVCQTRFRIFYSLSLTHKSGRDVRFRRQHVHEFGEWHTLSEILSRRTHNSFRQGYVGFKWHTMSLNAHLIPTGASSLSSAVPCSPLSPLASQICSSSSASSSYGNTVQCVPILSSAISDISPARLSIMSCGVSNWQIILKVMTVGFLLSFTLQVVTMVLTLVHVLRE